MGAPDPRLNLYGKQDFRIGRQLRSYGKADPPSTRVRPVPIQLIHAVFAEAQRLASPESICLGYMAYVAFFYLMRPGEYCISGDEPHPFRLRDVRLWIGTRQLDPCRAPFAILRRATFSGLVFTDQKNCVRGELIGHGRSGALYACPVRALVELVIRLRTAGGSPTTPLCSFRPRGSTILHHLTAEAFTEALRAQARICGETFGVKPSDISARSFRNAGAMALLCAGIDCDRIGLVGRWKSGAMLRYLLVQAKPVMRGFAPAMLRGGNMELIPSDAEFLQIPSADPRDPYAGDPY